MDVAGGELHRRLHRLVGIADLVIVLEIGLQPLHDLDRVLDRRLVDIDLLEAADERAILLEILAIFLVGRRADAAQGSLGKSRLEQIRRIHRPAGGGAGADDRVNLVDEEDRFLVVFDLLHHLFQPLFEIAAIARAGKQRAHIEGKDSRVGEHFRHFVLDDLPRQALGDRRLANARVADEQRIVLMPAAENLDRAQHFRLAADQWIDAPFLGLAIEVDAIGFERAFLLFRLAVLFILSVAAIIIFGSAGRLGGIRHTGPLRYTVADVVHRVVAGHILLLQEIGGMAFPFGENRHQDIGAGHFLAPG